MLSSTVLTLVPYILSLIISLWLGLLAARRRSVPGAFQFAWVAFSEVIWTLGYIGQLISPDLAGKLLWNNLQFLGAVGTPLAALGFALEYDRPAAGFWSRLSWRTFAPIAGLLLAFIWTDGIHHLFRVQPVLVADTPFSRLVFQDGPGFSLYTIFAYGLLVLMVAALFPRYLQAGQFYRLQIGVLLAGILVPWITSMVTALNLVPASLHDVTPLTFGISNLIIAWALFRYHLFEVLPAARDFLVENMQEGVLVVDHQLRIIDLNPAAERILDRPAGGLLGAGIGSLSPFEARWFAEMTSSSSRKLEMLLERPGFIGVYELQISLLNNPRAGAPVYLLILRDISDRKRFEEKLNYLAITDSLTHIFNRRHVLSRAAEEIARARETGRAVSFILIDIDHFKTVNDTFGHQMGDQVLQAMTERCQAALRGPDLLGRYGGEEFLVVLPGTRPGEARLIAERLRDQVESLVLNKDGREVRVTISQGVAGGVGEELDLDRLLDWSDRALYQAKAEGRNRVCVYQNPPGSRSLG